MAQKKTLGGDRLGSGKKMQVELHAYERSTHDVSAILRTTMSAGTLVPFLSRVALPGDTFDIELNTSVLTHPTTGPLFGSFKLQLDVFTCPIRLYQGKLHNNALGIGMKMQDVMLPQIAIRADRIDYSKEDVDNQQINPSSLFNYLGIRGVGQPADTEEDSVTREFNAIPYLAYWDIYKNYYANKQEEIGMMIHQNLTPVSPITGMVITSNPGGITTNTPINQGNNGVIQMITSRYTAYVSIEFSGTEPNPENIILYTNKGDVPIKEMFYTWASEETKITGYEFNKNYVNAEIYGYGIPDGKTSIAVEPKLMSFPLENLDRMRNEILAGALTNSAFIIDQTTFAPYGTALEMLATNNTTTYSKLYAQEGLAIKTYQSDIFNNWLSQEWIDGVNGISAVTAIDTSDGNFTIDTLNLSKKVYNMLNRIAISGGSYDDWLDAVYTHERARRMESPVYEGGLIKEVIFQEVISNSAANGEEGSEPLGTLAGRGTQSNKHKGGKVTIKIDEPSYIIGIVSLTPRIDYSQGNRWDTNLKTMDDFHKPALDQIGFQDLITDQMAFWETRILDEGNTPQYQSAGKQPAWINYQTDYNEVKGNFAIPNNEMYMTLVRRYEHDENGYIKDLTTYIDPVKYNHIFAQTSLDAQNFWVQIASNITARRKMSAKIIPNL